MFTDAPQFADLRNKLLAAKSPVFEPTAQEISWAQTDFLECKGFPFWRGFTFEGTAFWRRAQRLQREQDVQGARALRRAAIGWTAVGIAVFPAAVAAGITACCLPPCAVRSDEGIREASTAFSKSRKGRRASR